MIYMKRTDGQRLIILEPANLKVMKDGDFVRTPDGTCEILFTPDCEWVSQQIALRGTAPKELEAILEEGKTRAEVYTRPHHETRDLRDRSGRKMDM